MARRKINAGSLGVTIPVFVQDTSSATGAGLGSLVFNTASLAAKYRREGQSSWTTITLVTATLGTYVPGGFVADGGPVTGGYEFSPPNAVVAAGATWAEIEIYGATNMLPVLIEIELDAVNYQDATGFGLSRLDAAISSVGASVWNYLTASGTTLGSYGKKLADWVLGTDNRVKVSADAHTSGETVAGVTADVGITQAGADKAWNTAARTITDKTGFSLSTAGILAIWDQLLSVTFGAGSLGEKFKLWLATLGSDNRVKVTADAYTSGETVAGVTAGVTVSDKTGFSLNAAERVKLHPTQPDYAPSKAGDAMTLTSDERTAVANEVEAQIIDDTDSEKVLQAIVAKIAAANPDLSGLTLSAIAVAVRTEVERVGGTMALVKTDTGNLVTRVPSTAALETDITALKGGGWTTETLKALYDQVLLRLATSAYTAPDNANIAAAAASAAAGAASAATAASQATAGATSAATAATQASQANTKAGTIQTVTDKVGGMIEHPTTYDRLKATALEQAPSGSSTGASPEEIWTYGERTLTDFSFDTEPPTVTIMPIIPSALVAEVYQGFDYLAADGRALTLDVTGCPPLDAAEPCVLTYSNGKLLATGTVTLVSGDEYRFEFDLAKTLNLERGSLNDMRVGAVTSNGNLAIVGRLQMRVR